MARPSRSTADPTDRGSGAPGFLLGLLAFKQANANVEVVARHVSPAFVRFALDLSRSLDNSLQPDQFDGVDSVKQPERVEPYAEDRTGSGQLYEPAARQFPSAKSSSTLTFSPCIQAISSP